jgi:hypothetical protein
MTTGKQLKVKSRCRIRSVAPELLELNIDFPLFVPQKLPLGDDMQVETQAGGSSSNPERMAARFGVPYLGLVPMDPHLLSCCEEGKSFVEQFPTSPAVQALNVIVDQLVNV